MLETENSTSTDFWASQVNGKEYWEELKTQIDSSQLLGSLLGETALHFNPSCLFKDTIEGFMMAKDTVSKKKS